MTQDSSKKIDETWKDKIRKEPEKANLEENEDAPIKADFKFFVTSLSIQTWIALGLIPNPADQKTQENLPQAKFLIDSLEMIEQKTKGNLESEEKKLIEDSLYELRIAYVNKTTSPAKKEGAA